MERTWNRIETCFENNYFTTLNNIYVFLRLVDWIGCIKMELQVFAALFGAGLLPIQ